MKKKKLIEGKGVKGDHEIFNYSTWGQTKIEKEQRKRETQGAITVL